MLRICVFCFFGVFALAMPVAAHGNQDLFGDETLPLGGGAAERVLADGVLKVVPPEIDVNEGVVYPRPFPGLQAADYSPRQFSANQTLSGRTTGVVRYRDTWQLEFAFKELRYLEVKLPLPDGNSQAAGVWYLVYRVRNLDQHLSFPREGEAGDVKPNAATPLADLDPNTLPGRFFPSFLLEGWVEDLSGDYALRAYRDKVLPAAVPQIAAAEKMAGQLRDNVAMAREDLTDSDRFPDGVWGVATWLDVDPRINFAAVSVQGLSNAFRTDQDSDDPRHEVKTLQINFWRPGDSNLSNARFRLGVAFDDDQVIRQRQLLEKYRLPGPELVIDRTIPETGAPIRLGYVPADYDLDTRTSPLLQDLNQGQVPEALAQFLSRQGFEGAENFNVTTNLEDSRWTLQNAQGHLWTVTLQPVTWKVTRDKFDFIGPLDYFWDFRYIY